MSWLRKGKEHRGTFSACTVLHSRLSPNYPTPPTSLLPQVFSKNMSHKGEPTISACSSDDNWTSITFTPDLARFGMEALEEDTVALMRKRVYDMAGILGKGVKVGGALQETWQKYLGFGG